MKKDVSAVVKRLLVLYEGCKAGPRPVTVYTRMFVGEDQYQCNGVAWHKGRNCGYGTLMLINNDIDHSGHDDLHFC